MSAAFTVREIARAVGVETASALTLLGDGRHAGDLVPREEAVGLVRRLRLDAGSPEAAAPVEDPQPPELFAPPAHMDRAAGMPLAAAGSLHAAALAALLLAIVIGADVPATVVSAAERLQQVNLVYLAIPGPGGGGGGGGRRDRAPATQARRVGRSPVSSPLPVRQPAPAVVPAPRPEPPKPVIAAEPLPAVVAPVVPVPADSSSRAGVPAETRIGPESPGPGVGGGAGSGSGTGLGEGEGSGIGPGSGGGTGGGPYRPGSGVEPPALLREVRPTYTEAARLRGIMGEVVLEVVVRRDGSVGSARVVQGLGSGLDERALEAVRQWKFAPARRVGVPVDVLVEVAVEFRLR